MSFGWCAHQVSVYSNLYIIAINCARYRHTTTTTYIVNVITVGADLHLVSFISTFFAHSDSLNHLFFSDCPLVCLSALFCDYSCSEGGGPFIFLGCKQTNKAYAEV